MKKDSTCGNKWKLVRDKIVFILLKEVKTQQEWWCCLDKADFEKVRKFRWHAKRFKNAPVPYAASSRRIDGKCVTILMHRYILGVNDRNIHVDHVDHDTLNNCRDNLRPSSPSHNALNRVAANKNSKIGIRGVYRKGNRYAAKLGNVHLGYYSSVEDASQAWNRAFAANCKTDPKVARWL